MKTQTLALLAGPALALAAAGCVSPYHADRGALFGGVTGAGVGAIVGSAVGEPLAGAAIGAGVGTLTGAAVGSGMDEVEARNRAEIEARIGRPVAPGGVNIGDVIAMTRAGVNEDIIINHIRYNGMVQPLQTGDLIALQNSGISPRVVQVMQESTGPRATVQGAPPPVIIEEHVYPPPPPPWRPPPPYRYRHW